MLLNNIVAALISLLLFDVVFLVLLVAIVALLSGTKRAAYAVMRRNFLAYFSNPTGYVFLCIFVFLTSLAAFWPYEFFNQNLATLDQLNYWFPLIMLVFIPAITMSIWAEEKRQGTDELLLTLPADDFDIVIGKYMSATAIFTASLMFSQLSTFVTLAILTDGLLDTGLIFTTYLGYWFVGLAMIAIGMVASFFTGNLTVGFILGSLFNAPLAFASLANSISPSQQMAQWIASAGIARPFDDFGRGVISISSVIYFVFLASLALYACMVLIGRRHWTGGKDGNTMAWHYLARVLALVVFTCGAVMLFRSWDVVRYDATEGKVSSLAPATKKLIRELDSDRPIVIDAFISSEIPEIYARTRYELVNLLKEFRSEAAKRDRTIELNLYDGIELFSDEADLAAKRFNIQPVTRMVREKGAPQEKQLILGAAFRSGPQKVVVPIFEYGIPVEYELVRSINTVARGAKKRIGIVTTDARLFGGTVMQGMGMQRVPRHPLIDELEKQYDVDEVDLNSPVSPETFDALFVVQPSSLAPPQFDRLVDAVQAGVPTAIFEDPAPVATGFVTPTGAPKQSPGGMFGGGGPMPKGDIRALWEALEINCPGQPGMQGMYSPDLVWQQFNPYMSLEASANALWVFVDDNSPGGEPGRCLSSDSPITSGMSQVLTIMGGAVEAKSNSSLQHTTILRTGVASGLIPGDRMREAMSDTNALARLMAENQSPDVGIAMTIESSSDETASAGEEEASSTTGGDAGIKAVYVADSDLMIPEFLMIRADPDQVTDSKFQFQNVTFVLNCIDWLTGEIDFIEVRKHQPSLNSLRMIDSVKEEAMTAVQRRSQEFQDEFDEEIREAQEDIDEKLKKLQEQRADLRKQRAEGSGDRAKEQAIEQQFQTELQRLNNRLETTRERLNREREQKVRDIERLADQEVTKIQNQVKAAAVAIPCIPPLIIGVVVFASRRLRERENISKSRLK